MRAGKTDLVDLLESLFSISMRIAEGIFCPGTEIWLRFAKSESNLEEGGHNSHDHVVEAVKRQGPIQDGYCKVRSPE